MKTKKKQLRHGLILGLLLAGMGWIGTGKAHADTATADAGEVTAESLLAEAAAATGNEAPPETPPSETPAEEANVPASKGDERGGDTPSGKKEPEKPEFDEKTLADLRSGKIIPKHRFDEVIASIDAYKAFGTPEEVKAKIEAAVKASRPPEQPKTAALTPEEKAAAESIRKAVFNAVPELAELAKLKSVTEQLQLVKGEQDLRYNEFTTGATRKMIEHAGKEFGLDTAKASVAKNFVNTVAEIINSDPNMARRFHLNYDMGVVEEALKIYQDDFLSGPQMRREAAILAQKRKTGALPATPRGTPVPPGKPPVDISKKSLLDIGNEAWEAFQGDGASV